MGWFHPFDFELRITKIILIIQWRHFIDELVVFRDMVWIMDLRMLMMMSIDDLMVKY